MKQKATQILKFLEFSSNLKKQERTIKLSWERNESVADHSWQLSLMVLLVYPYLDKKIDLLKTLKMALVHDLAEAEIGDIPHGQTALNPKLKQEKRLKEEKEIKKIRNMLKSDKLGQEIYDLWHEIEALETQEAKFIKALDSVEANHQSTLFDVSYWDNYFYKIALTKAKKYCKHEKILAELDRQVTSNMKKEFKKAGINVNKIK